jgi:alginate O-acetyltransferase complex protein AlgI
MVWKPIYILLIILSTLIDYYCSVKMGQLETKKERKPYIVVSVFSNLLILGLFKYFNFFNSAANDLAALLNIPYAVSYLNVILPMGISFYTFQTMSYSIDVYRGTMKPETHIGKFALYVTFFPQLVAGPIERARNLLPQFHFKYDYDHDRTISGLRLILWGLFKKIVIADQLSSMVSHVYGNPDGAQGFSIYFAALLFSQQIYCDFSGYSDIAQGAARIMGIKLMDNFSFPFYATTYNGFWGKWHTSLMQWFRDYIMMPLIRKKMKWQFVFFIVFFTSGLWHGANWTFIISGIMTGILVVYSKSSSDFRKKIALRIKLDKIPRLREVLQIISVYHLFTFSGIFFPAKSFADVKTLTNNFFTGWSDLFSNLAINLNGFRQDVLYLGKDVDSFTVIIILLIIFETIQWKMSKDSIDNFFIKKPRWYTWGIYLFLIFSIIIMSNIEETPFIYFQF